MISIYGVFSKTGECLYVGQSVRPFSRISEHVHLGRFKGHEIGSLRILEEAKTNELACAHEQRLISAYKATGQCVCNKRPGSINRRDLPCRTDSINARIDAELLSWIKEYTKNRKRGVSGFVEDACNVARQEMENKS